MLTNVRIRNYKCFEDHYMVLKPLTIAVGRNNAGKSSLIEALRFVSICLGVYENINYRNSEYAYEGELTRRDRGIAPSMKGVTLRSENIFHRYGEPPAVIEANFSAGGTATIFLVDRKTIFCKFTDRKGNQIKSKSDAQTVKFPSVGILPSIGPLKTDEKVLSKDYVRASMNSHLVSQHFRNQLNLFYSTHFSRFKNFAEETWDGLRILELEGRNGLHDDELKLLVRDGDFVADIGEMGHGLQIWLQTIWFLTLAARDDVLILDEPDVYLHADMQRKLIRLAKRLKRQIIIATHSLEIISDVEPEDILVVDKRNNSSKYANNLPSVQSIVENLGSVQNIHLAKLWSIKKCLLTEGKDIKILKHIFATLYPDAKEPLDTYPNAELGGWSGWPYAIGTQKMINATGEDRIQLFCIFDRDYHTDDEISKRVADAKKHGIHLHVWSMKEIENYMLVPSVIARVIENEQTKGETPNVQTISDAILKIANSMKDDILDNIATGYAQVNRREDPQCYNRYARERFLLFWTDYDGITSLLPGKNVLSTLSEFSQQTFGVSLNAVKLARSMRKSEIHTEISALLSHIK